MLSNIDHVTARSVPYVNLWIRFQLLVFTVMKIHGFLGTDTYEDYQMIMRYSVNSAFYKLSTGHICSSIVEDGEDTTRLYHCSSGG